ncbi:hypothetical protein LH53_00425 [Mesotoga sp. TolDC]|nr:hypothetical protein LH53_11205 [Mesotoga sp. TolDC]PZC53180.1 hypothetical protein LH53_00425 [Mesotoga sp. TolDC]
MILVLTLTKDEEQIIALELERKKIPRSGTKNRYFLRRTVNRSTAKQFLSLFQPPISYPQTLALEIAFGLVFEEIDQNVL